MNLGLTKRRMNVGKKPNYLMTSETNPEVLAILFANGLCSSSEYLTYAEAASITSFPSKLFFKANIKSFDEFEFFGITTIPGDCFNSCSTLTSLTLSDKITYINGSGLRNCASLKRITCKATTPPTCAGNYVFGATNPDAIYVPAASVDAYKSAHSWDAFADRIFAIE